MADITGQQASLNSVKCVVVGKELADAAKALKPGIPKKRQEAMASMVIRGVKGGLEFSLPGATVTAKAIVPAQFNVFIPWLMFKLTLLTPRKATDLVQLEFAEQSIIVDEIATRSNQIVFQLEHQPVIPIANEAKASNVSGPLDRVDLPDPSTIPLGSPMLEAWVYMRKYGLQRLLVNQAFSRQQEELERLLQTASKLLQPTGILRSDLERLLNAKAGIR